MMRLLPFALVALAASPSLMALEPAKIEGGVVC
jgi:hypothetical protein